MPGLRTKSWLADDFPHRPRAGGASTKQLFSLIGVCRRPGREPLRAISQCGAIWACWQAAS